MTQYFEYKDDKSSKFWEITIADISIITRYGKIGTEGKTNNKSFANQDLAKKEYNKLIQEKIKKGYIEDTTKSVAEDIIEPQKSQSVNKIGKWSLVGVEEFYEKHSEEKLNWDFCNMVDPNRDRDHLLLVCDGGAYFEGEVTLTGASIAEYTQFIEISNADNWNQDYRPTGIVILGNLEVKKSLIDIAEFFLTVYIRGNLKAQNLVAADCSILVDGDANIQEVLYGYYNDGMLQVKGITSTQLFLPNDHHMDVRFKNKPKSFSQLQKANIIKSDIYTDDVLDLLYKNKSIFASDEPVVQDYHYWLDLMQRNGKNFKKVPEEFIDEEICLLAVICDYSNLDRIPKQFLTTSLVCRAIERENSIVSSLPHTVYNQEVIETIVKHARYKLIDIPFKFQTKEMFVEAVKLGAGFRAVPLYFLDEDLVCEILKYDSSSYNIERLPKKFWTFNVLVLLATLGTLPFYYGDRIDIYEEEFPFGLDDIGLEAIKNGVEVLDKIPGYLISDVVYNVAKELYAQGSTATRWNEVEAEHNLDIEYDLDDEDDAFTKIVWRVFWTQEYIENAIKEIYTPSTQASFIQYIPREYITPHLGFIITKASHHNYKYLPNNAKDNRNTTCALQESPYCFDEIPKELITEELCLMTVSESVKTEFGTSEGSGYSLKDIPYEYRNEKICKEGLESDNRALSAIPLKYSYLLENISSN